MMLNLALSSVFLFLLCSSVSVFGYKDGDVLSAKQIKEFEVAFAEANALALAPAPAQSNNSIPLPCISGGACRDMVEKYGYKCEEHTVTTKDGHILSMQKIPAKWYPTSSNSSEMTASRPPVLLQHGLFCDGIAWMAVERDSLPFYLADIGFDVWVNNNRGTTYSKCHKWSNIFEPAFWDFSWQELSEIDLDATVSYIHRNTGQKVHYVGHSMGTMVALAALSVNQPTIHKMRSVALLAPIGHMGLLWSPFGRISADLFLAELRDLIKLHEFNPFTRIPATFCAKICSIFRINCAYSLWFATGPNCCIDRDSFVRFLEHEPQSTATKVLTHMSQNIRHGGFKKFDYGLIGNMMRYKQATPPVYAMDKIPKDFPIFLGYGALDSLADILDVLKLIFDLRWHNQTKLVKKFQLFYAHMDYQLAHNARRDVYEPIAQFFKSN